MSDSRKLDTHVFVCTNTKANGKDCTSKGALELREKLKLHCQKTREDWHGRVRINASGCLGRCEDGATVVIYPQNIWHTGLSANSEAVVLEDLTKILDAK